MADKKAAWKNRMITEGELPAGDFLANPDNWRVHPKPQQEAVTGILDDVGWVQRVIVNVRTSEAWGDSRGVETLVDGHLRVTLALRQGEETLVPVEYVDLDPAEEALVLASLDPITAMAVEDRPKLLELMNRLETDKPALQAMLSELAERSGLVNLSEPADGDQEEEEERSDASLLSLVNVAIDDPAHVVERGEVWEVGNHLLVCCEVVTEWRLWRKYLEGENTLFMPYPGSFVALSELAETMKMVMVQPDPFIAGHILDRFSEVNGSGAVRRIFPG